MVNGAPVLRKEWRKRRIRVGDRVEFWSRPMGGGQSGQGQSQGGKQVIGFVALIAVAALALAAPYLVAGAFPALASGTPGGALLSAGIGIGGSLLISSLTAPRAGAANVAQQGATGSASGTDQVLASIQATGNQIKPFAPIPVSYGRIRTYPDFAASPWSEFSGNDQYLNVLLSLGLGKYSAEAVHIDDTLLWSSATGVQAGFDASVAFYDPGQTVTLFPTNIVSSGEVSGQEIIETAGGWFVANAADTDASKIAVDLVFPGGLYSVPSDATSINQIGGATITVVAQYQEIDNSGVPVGGISTLFSQPFVLATRNPIRHTVLTAVAPGRYQVRLYRTTPPASAQISTGEGYRGNVASEVIDNVAWAGLRAFIDGVAAFPVSTCAIRIKADRLNANSVRKFAVTSTRKLNVWNGSAFVEQASRNPIWAFYDAAVDTTYGAARPPSKIDFNTVVAEAAAADSRGDCFDYEFGAAVLATEALDMTLRPARARHFWSGDVISIVRDEAPSVPDMLLTDREIVRGSLSYEAIINDEESSDAVIIEYVNEETWKPASVQYPPNDINFTAENPTTIRIDGIVKTDNAFEAAAFYYLQSIYRRQHVRLDTEWDGRRLHYGSRARVQSELPQTWGWSGAVLANASGTLTVDPAPSWDDIGTYSVRLRDKTGRVFGPVICTRGADDAHIVLDPADLASVEADQGTTLAAVLAREDGGEFPSYDFGVGDKQSRDCLVLSGRPSGENHMSLELVVDNPLIYSTDIGDPPVLPSGNLPPGVVTPVVAYITASFRQGVAEPILEASWVPAEGAQYYRAGVSYDGGVSWVQIYEGIATNFSVIVDRAALKLRVAGIGVAHGPFSIIDVAAPSIAIAPQTTVSSSFIDGLRDWIDTQIAGEIAALRREVQDLALSSMDNAAVNYTDKRSVRSDLVASEGRSSAAIATEEIVRAGEDAALAASITSLSATVTSNYTTLNSAISTEAVTRANADNSISATVTSLSATVTSNYATLDSAIDAEETARVNAINTVSSNLTSESATRASADTAISASITSLSATVTSNYATLDSAITSEAATRASADSAIASDVTTLEATVDGHTSSISVNAAAIADIDGNLAASYGIAVTAGVGASLVLLADGSSSGIKLDADQIVLDGSVTLDKLSANSVDTDKLTVNSVSIEKLIDGSCSIYTYAIGVDYDVNITGAYHPSSYYYSGSQTITLASTSIDTLTGEIVVFVQCYMAYNTAVQTGWFHYFDIVVDGVIRKTFTITQAPGVATVVTTLSRKHVVGGLSDGSHTVVLKTRLPSHYNSPYATGGVFTHYDNFIMPSERRR